jgi:hypothetical protein
LNGSGKQKCLRVILIEETKGDLLMVTEQKGASGSKLARFSCKWIVALLFALFAIGASGFTAAYAATTSNAVVNQGPAVVVASSYQAMDAAMNSGAVVRHPSLSRENPQQLLSAVQAHVNNSPGGAFLYSYDLYRISVFRSWAALHTHDYSTINAWSTFQVTSTVIQGTQAVVTGNETLHIDATVQDNGQSHKFSPAKQAVQGLIKSEGLLIGFGQTNYAKAIISHTVTLSLTNSGWAIESDSYWDPLAQSLTSDHHSVQEGSPSSSNTYGQNKNGMNGNHNNMSPDAYNRQGAINYADTWWNSCNPNYACYESQDADCANFVSQSLYDGSGGNMDGDNSWYAGSYDFINADGLYHYMSSNRASASYSSYDYNTAAYDDDWYEYPGDIIFYDWGNVFGFGNADGVIDHTAISVYQDSNGYTYEDAHTTNLYHYYWDLGGGNQTGYYFVIISG